MDSSTKIVTISDRFGRELAKIEAIDTRDALQILVAKGAVLRSADLSGAVLRSAVLSGAVLSGAVLRSAVGINPYLCTPLLLLKDQPGAIRAYKLVDGNYDSPMHHKKIHYAIGQTYTAEDVNTDVLEHCGAGINLATLDWCMKEWKNGYHILIAEFTAADIAAIPTATDGKFRCSKVTIVGEVDLEKIGLIVEEATS